MKTTTTSKSTASSKGKLKGSSTLESILITSLKRQNHHKGFLFLYFLMIEKLG